MSESKSADNKPTTNWQIGDVVVVDTNDEVGEVMSVDTDSRRLDVRFYSDVKGCHYQYDEKGVRLLDRAVLWALKACARAVPERLMVQVIHEKYQGLMTHVYKERATQPPAAPSFSSFSSQEQFEKAKDFAKDIQDHDRITLDIGRRKPDADGDYTMGGFPAAPALDQEIKAAITAYVENHPEFKKIVKDAVERIGRSIGQDIREGDKVVYVGPNRDMFGVTGDVVLVDVGPDHDLVQVNFQTNTSGYGSAIIPPHHLRFLSREAEQESENKQPEQSFQNNTDYIVDGLRYAAERIGAGLVGSENDSGAAVLARGRPMIGATDPLPVVEEVGMLGDDGSGDRLTWSDDDCCGRSSDHSAHYLIYDEDVWCVSDLSRSLPFFAYDKTDMTILDLMRLCQEHYELCIKERDRVEQPEPEAKSTKSRLDTEEMTWTTHSGGFFSSLVHIGTNRFGEQFRIIDAAPPVNGYRAFYTHSGHHDEIGDYRTYREAIQACSFYCGRVSPPR